MHMKNQESVLKVSVLLSDEQTVAASTVDVEVLLILEIALEERRAFTIAMQFFCGTFSSTTLKEYLSVDTVILTEPPHGFFALAPVESAIISDGNNPCLYRVEI